VNADENNQERERAALRTAHDNDVRRFPRFFRFETTRLLVVRRPRRIFGERQNGRKKACPSSSRRFIFHVRENHRTRFHRRHAERTRVGRAYVPLVRSERRRKRACFVVGTRNVDLHRDHVAAVDTRDARNPRKRYRTDVVPCTRGFRVRTCPPCFAFVRDDVVFFFKHSPRVVAYTYRQATGYARERQHARTRCSVDGNIDHTCRIARIQPHGYKCVHIEMSATAERTKNRRRVTLRNNKRNERVRDSTDNLTRTLPRPGFCTFGRYDNFVCSRRSTKSQAV